MLLVGWELPVLPCTAPPIPSFWFAAVVHAVRVLCVLFSCLLCVRTLFLYVLLGVHVAVVVVAVALSMSSLPTPHTSYLVTTHNPADRS